MRMNSQSGQVHVNNFTHLRTARKEHVNLLSNGAGKSFVSKLFETLDLQVLMLQPSSAAEEHVLNSLSHSKNEDNTEFSVFLQATV